MTDRAVSVTVGYAMNLALMTILLSGLLIASGGLIETERERIAAGELDAIGQRIAAQLMAADRLAEASDAPAGQLTVSAPARVAGSEYSVTVEDDRLVLAATDVDAETTVRFAAPVKETRVTGGDLVITLADEDELAVSER